MKSLTIFFCSLVLFFHNSNAQSKCSKFYPSEAGASRTLTLYDKDDVEQGSVTYTVKEVIGDQMIYSVAMARGGATMMNNEYPMTCNDDGVSIDFNSLGGAMAASMRPDNATITGTDIYLPNRLEVNQVLGDAEMVISNSMDVGGRTVNTTMTMRMYNRKVTALEDINTPAGEFPESYKLEYYTEMSNTTPALMGGGTTSNVLFKMKTEQWLYPNVGVVMTKDYMEEIVGGTKMWVLQSWGQLTAKN